MRARQVPWITTGTGKTHLAIGLAIRGCQAGHRVQFATAAQWVARLAEAHHAGRLQAELVRLGRYPLLVIDEVGYIPFEPEAAILFFQLVSARYERASLIVTSNKAVRPVGRNLRRRSSRRRDDRPARPPRRSHRPQRRLLPAQRPRPRPGPRGRRNRRLTINMTMQGVNFQAPPGEKHQAGQHRRPFEVMPVILLQLLYGFKGVPSARRA
jgi:IstB-like ATP binding protein